MTEMTLSALIALPAAGGLLAWLLGRANAAVARAIALVAALATFALSITLWLTVGDAAFGAATFGRAWHHYAEWILEE